MNWMDRIPTQRSSLKFLGGVMRNNEYEYFYGRKKKEMQRKNLNKR